jgi:hypothetical protein
MPPVSVRDRCYSGIPLELLGFAFFDVPVGGSFAVGVDYARLSVLQSSRVGVISAMTGRRMDNPTTSRAGIKMMGDA